MPEFIVIPFDGPIPLHFGMTPLEVAEVLGPPTWSHRNPSSAVPAGILIEQRIEFNVNVGYAAGDDKLNEAVFTNGAHLYLEEQNLFDLSDPVSFLRKYGTAQEWLGSIVFTGLGIMLTPEVSDNGALSEWTIAVAVKDHWGQYEKSFVDICDDDMT